MNFVLFSENIKNIIIVYHTNAEVSISELIISELMLFEKVNSTLVWILLIPYTTSLTMDLTYSIYHTFNYGLY